MGYGASQRKRQGKTGRVLRGSRRAVSRWGVSLRLHTWTAPSTTALVVDGAAEREEGGRGRRDEGERGRRWVRDKGEMEKGTTEAHHQPLSGITEGDCRLISDGCWWGCGLVPHPPPPSSSLVPPSSSSLLPSPSLQRRRRQGQSSMALSRYVVSNSPPPPANRLPTAT